MNVEEIEKYIAISFINGLGDVNIKRLIDKFGSVDAILKSNPYSFKSIDGIGDKLAHMFFSNIEKCLQKAKKIVGNIDFKEIDFLAYGKDNYPLQLNNFENTPVCFFTKGNFCFKNKRKFVSIVGTRKMTEYGRSFIEKLVKHLSGYNCVIVSGLANGVDEYAHRIALRENLDTIAVLGNGINNIYPYNNIKLSKEIINKGCLMSEFLLDEKPLKENFPKRNRTIAAISDCTIVIESNAKGGSIITANLANDYNKDVFALIGNINSPCSIGCNNLVKYNLANAITEPQDVSRIMCWNYDTKKIDIKKNLNLSVEQKNIFDIISNQQKIHFDKLLITSKLKTNDLSMILFELETEELIKSNSSNYYYV